MANEKITIKKKLENNLKTEDVKYRKAETILINEESELKKLEVIEKSIEIDDMREKSKESSEYTKMSKVMLLTYVLSSSSIDDESTTIGSEIKLRCTFDEGEQQIIKKKIFTLIDKL